MAAPLVSIVVNNFNYARFVGHAIESALGQTHTRTEVVVVDDCSSDGSVGVIQSFGSRVVPVLLPINGGQGAAMNAGFAACRGDLVIFLDSDDFLYPTAAERAAAALAPGVGTIQYRLHLVDGDEKVIDLYPSQEVSFDRGDVIPKLLATGRYEGTVTSGIAFARDTLSAVMPIPADHFRIAADGYLVSAAPFHGKVVAIDEALGAYRRHGANFWLMAGADLAKSYRRSILHDADKHRVIAERAAAAGLVALHEPGLRDYQHVGVRLGSLLLDPAQHPYPRDGRFNLALAGVVASRRASLPRRRRRVLAAWFLLVGLLPRRLARPIFVWRIEPAHRPAAVNRVLRVLRRATR